MFGRHFWHVLALLALTSVMMGGAAHAQSRGVIFSSVKADGVTSDDAQLRTDLTNCARVGGTLILPPGQILLDGTGGLTSVIKECAIVGAGFLSGSNSPQYPTSYGTTILLTSPTVQPFILGAFWSIEGVNFYWPNQTSGTAVYPPLFTDNGSATVSQGILRKVGVVNAYDFMKQTNGAHGGAWDALRFTDCEIYATHSAFNLTNIGDGFSLMDVRFEPGQWFGLAGSTAEAAVNTVSGSNRIFDVEGPTVVLNVTNGLGYAFGTGIYIASGAVLGESHIDMTWDSIPTILDSSAGGEITTGTKITGENANCGRAQIGSSPPSPGNAPCFNLGPSGDLDLVGFLSGGNYGTFIQTAGASVHFMGGDAVNIGSIKDGSDYYGILATGSGNRAQIVLEGVTLAGVGTAHEHAISANADTFGPSTLIIENSQFYYFNDLFNIVPSNGTTIITGNSSDHTLSTTPFNFNGSTNAVLWANNFFDHPLNATATCGVPCSSVEGAISGTITVGSAGGGRHEWRSDAAIHTDRLSNRRLPLLGAHTRHGRRHHGDGVGLWHQSMDLDRVGRCSE